MTVDAAPLLSVRNVSVRFKLRRSSLFSRSPLLTAVDDVSFDLRAGEALGVVGESGCGKSTLARTVLRLIPATSGAVFLGGRDVLALRGASLREVRRNVQMIFQDPV